MDLVSVSAWSEMKWGKTHIVTLDPYKTVYKITCKKRWPNEIHCNLLLDETTSICRAYISSKQTAQRNAKQINTIQYWNEFKVFALRIGRTLIAEFLSKNIILMINWSHPVDFMNSDGCLRVDPRFVFVNYSLDPSFCFHFQGIAKSSNRPAVKQKTEYKKKK